MKPAHILKFEKKCYIFRHPQKFLRPKFLKSAPKIVSKIQDSAAILKGRGWSIEEVECPSFLPLADINLKL